ncbi:hypothetical protein NDU88_004701 [Pleurodeles waltl]|uniref:Uncharacterized protein n=1 Tax=Pleurodeles waltl TaxID=8319 RepID=A0AAV7MAS8_PLEWA|nr:hypothetical protein NDU88_004701 [Pleurodeles waltl]
MEEAGARGDSPCDLHRARHQTPETDRDTLPSGGTKTNVPWGQGEKVQETVEGDDTDEEDRTENVGTAAGAQRRNNLVHNLFSN